MPHNILSLPPKRSSNITSSLSQTIRDYISQNYTETHPQAFAKDIKDLCRLRQEATKLQIHISSIHTALEYHAQLVFFSTRFPNNIGISFPWTLSFPSGEIYDDSQVVSHPTLLYERANILFSLASLYSALGTAEARSDSDSIKRSISWFQSAAGVLQHIHSSILQEISHLKPSCHDLQPSLLQALRDLMLAQAQECFWQKAVLDRLKNNTISKLAERVGELYASSLQLANDSLPIEWTNHITVKRYHFAAAAQYRKSMDDLGANRYGDELGRLKLAESHVRKALDSSKRGVSQAILSDLKSLQSTIATNIQRGTKDNDLIYMEPVTTPSNLQPILAAGMVKPVIPNQVTDPILLLREGGLGPLFAELVPYAVHLAISIYKDRKDSLIRELSEKRDEMDRLANSTLQSLQLPGSLQALEQPMGLPPSLLRRHEQIVSEGGITRLDSLITDVSRIAQTDHDILSEAFLILDQEAKQDESFRETSQASFPRPTSLEASAELRAQGERYAQTLRQAASSDSLVRQKLEDWEDLIGVLSRGVSDLKAFVPNSAPCDTSSEKQAKAVRGLRSELEKLDDLIDQRAACLYEASALASNDDIRPSVLRSAAQMAEIETAQFEPLFEQALANYNSFVQEMTRSHSAQQKLLQRISERNAEFTDARNIDTTIKRRQKALQNLDVAHSKYRELASNLVEGLAFYNNLAKMLTAYRQDVKEWHRARHLDMANLTSQFAGTSLEQHQDKVPQWGAFPGGEIRFGD